MSKAELIQVIRKEYLSDKANERMIDGDIYIIIKSCEPYYRGIAKEAVDTVDRGGNNCEEVIFKTDAIKAIDDVMGGE